MSCEIKAIGLLHTNFNHYQLLQVLQAKINPLIAILNMGNRLELHLLFIAFFLIISIDIQCEGAAAANPPKKGRPGPRPRPIPQVTPTIPERVDSLEYRISIMESGKIPGIEFSKIQKCNFSDT
jgi:hypothetical protein